MSEHEKSAAGRPSLDNAEIAALFAEMADLMQIKGGDRHRIMAFRRVARILEALPRPAVELLQRGELGRVRGIGEGTIHRIKQMLRTRSCDDLEQLRRELPPGLRELIQIKGIGPTTIRNIYNRLGIRDLDELEYAAKSGAIEAIPRMGGSVSHKILAGIAAYRARRGKVPLIEAQRIGRRIVASLAELRQVQRIELAGSVRRGKAAIGDLDILVASVDTTPIAARFQTLPDVQAILLAGESRCSVRLRNGLQADLRLLPPQSFGAGLHYFTGSKAHNIEIRKRGTRLGFKVGDKGVFRRTGDPATESLQENLVDPCPEELDVFRRVNLPWIPPELRENLGEIEAAERGRLPQLIVREQLLGDLHMHTHESDGSASIEAMAGRARALGLRYVAITDHSKAMHIARGLDEARLADQLARIRARGSEHEGVRVLAGIEVDILADGSLDLDPALLARLDFVVASVHRWTDMREAAMSDRVIRAIRSGVVDCIGHPTGRRPGKRDPFPIDLESVMMAAREFEVALECNGGPNRMDLGDVECRKCKERGVAIAINTDAHAPEHLGRFEYGLSMARRGWLGAGDVLNAMPVEQIVERRRRRLRDHGEAEWGVVPLVVQVPRALAPTPASEPGEAHAWGELDDVPMAVEIASERAAADEDAREEAELDATLVPIDVAASAGEGSEGEGSEGEVEGSEGEASEPDPDAIARLAERLQGDPEAIDEPLAERLAAWVTSGAEDPELAAALGRVSDNPLQAGFDRLLSIWNRGG
jgi:DNA polymerase (family 10)